MGIKVDDQSNLIVVTFAGDLAKDLVGATTKEVNNLISKKKIKNVVFHLDNCLSAEESVLFEIAEIVQSVRRFDGGGRLVGVNKEIYRQLKETSLDRILLERNNLKSATQDMGYDLSDEEIENLKGLIEERVMELKKEIQETAAKEEKPEVKKEAPKKKEKPNQIDVQFINHFLQSTTTVLGTQFELECKAGKPMQKKPQSPILYGEVCGLISIDSEYFQGTMSISFPEKVFLSLVSAVFGEEEEGINDENIDLIGEIANIVLGDAKRKLSEDGYKVSSALPHCVWVKDKLVTHERGLAIVIPYSTKFGEFYTEILEGRDVVSIQNKIASAA